MKDEGMVTRDGRKAFHSCNPSRASVLRSLMSLIFLLLRNYLQSRNPKGDYKRNISNSENEGRVKRVMRR